MKSYLLQCKSFRNVTARQKNDCVENLSWAYLKKRWPDGNEYQFCIFEDEMQDIIKTYTYAYSGEEI